MAYVIRALLESERIKVVDLVQQRGNRMPKDLLASDIYRQIQAKIASEIKCEDDEKLLKLDINKHIDNLFDKHRLREIVIDRKRKGRVKPAKEWRQVKDPYFDDYYNKEILCIHIHIPVVPNNHISELIKLSSNYTTQEYPALSYKEDGFLVMRVDDEPKYPDSGEDTALEQIACCNSDIRNANAQLREFIREKLEQRRLDIGLPADRRNETKENTDISPKSFFH